MQTRVGRRLGYEGSSCAPEGADGHHRVLFAHVNAAPLGSGTTEEAASTHGARRVRGVSTSLPIPSSAMTRRIAVDDLGAQDERVTVDGVEWRGASTIAHNRDSLMRLGCWLDGERVYDAEVVLNGQRPVVIPPREPWVDMAYDVLENG